MTSIQDAILAKKAALADRVGAPLSALADRCAQAWPDPERLDTILLGGISGLPHCHLLYAWDLNGIAVSAQKDGVLPLSQHSIFVLASLSYHDYEGVALRDDEKPRLVADLGPDHNFLMLRNHGLLTLGPSVAEAFLAMYFFETVCTIQVRAQAGGGALVHVDPRIIAGAQAQAKAVTRGIGPGALTWPGLLRRLDRTDPGYRD